MTAAERHAAVREMHAKGMSDKQIADTLGLHRRQITRMRRLLGLPCNVVRTVYSDAERQFIRQQYGRMTAGQIAAMIGRTATSVSRAAKRLGVSRSVPRLEKRPGLVEKLRALHARGLGDTEIGGILNVDRHHVRDLRRRIGLPDNRWTEHMRAKVRRKTAEQLRKAGLTSIGQLRPLAHRKFARDHGWPEDLKFRQVQILELLWQNGPMTKNEIGQALGMRVKCNRHHGPHYPMMCNDPSNRATTSYTGDLLRRGLIISLGRIVRNRPPGAKSAQGHNTVLYSLPLTIERRSDGKAC